MRRGDIRYGLRTDKRGAVLADLTVWKTAVGEYEIYSGRYADITALKPQVSSADRFEDLSEHTGILSLQGPNSLEVLSRFADTTELAALKYFKHATVNIAGQNCLVGRLGYTGEKGFEIVTDSLDHAGHLWQTLCRHVMPAGMIAADMLRIEAGFILFLNECRLGCSPSELGLGRFSREGGNSDRYQLIGFVAKSAIDDTALPWSAPLDVSAPGEGEILVTSANQNRSGSGILGLGLVRSSHQESRDLIDPSFGFANIQQANLPFYDRNKLLPRGNW